MASWQGAKKLNLSNEHWHFIGILGTGMRSMATYAAERGARITGSDIQPSPVAEALSQRGIGVSLDQQGRNLDRNTNLVVVSQAISEDNPELMEAHRLGLQVLRYPELLGQLMESQTGIAVAGTHGKSTTSSIIAYTMRHGGLDPSFLIGADVPQLGGGSHYGSGEYLVAEACEYKRSFLYLTPDISVITNIDADHLDYYYDMWDIQEAFADFVRAAGEEGLVIANGDDENTRAVIQETAVPALTYGIDDKDAVYRAERLWRAKVHSNFDLVYRGKKIDRFSTQLYGTHNVLNSLAAIAACHQAGMDFAAIKEALAEFEGVARRLQLLGTPWNVPVVSDYAHHPKEIEASLAATHQRFPGQRVFVIFQPHQYSRTRKMLPQLAESFRSAWVTYVCDIYAARDSEEDQKSVSALDVVRQMNHTGILGHYVPEFEDMESIIVGDVIPDDVVVVMGAGNIWQVARDIIPRITEKGRRQIAA
ncbi:MAG: UDP-N-acetylmuramate--L-alanine ligase [Candidatus Brocadiae bacterium]|nr:UDP-N-acetylmuramate--L-alanine ligase [Candidatus Brocadiia bacterium]